MREEIIRRTISKLWRNHPEAAATFSGCSVYGCSKAARDGLCDEHLIRSLYADGSINRGLFEIAYNIREIRRLESDIIELTEED